MNNLVNVSVLFGWREENSAAHNLASIGVSPSVSFFFTGFAAVPAVLCNQNSCVSAPV
jgi:hypothetical protein